MITNMKNAINIFLSITLTSLTLQACSCNQSDQCEDADFYFESEWESSPDELENWEKEFEEEYEEGWKEWAEDVREERVNMSKEEYESLLKFYKENYDILTQEEKEYINRQIGQYNGQIVKDEMERAEDAVKKTENVFHLLWKVLSVSSKNKNIPLRR